MRRDEQLIRRKRTRKKTPVVFKTKYKLSGNGTENAKMNCQKNRGIR